MGEDLPGFARVLMLYGASTLGWVTFGGLFVLINFSYGCWLGFCRLGFCGRFCLLAGFPELRFCCSLLMDCWLWGLLGLF